MSRFKHEAELSLHTNAMEFGPAAPIDSRDIGRVLRLGEAVEVGMIGMHTARLSSDAAPFGGVKQSGLGKDGSRQGIADYLEFKCIVPAPISDPSERDLRNASHRLDGFAEAV
ncbi:MAG: aldehyde dehydrogenase family protein [Proteobacteria bacterium]|nr:aldehyde dehydrogenase family protein [Pseudomonadota bacterium]